MAFSQREFLAFSRQPCRPVCLGLPFCHRTKRSPQHREPSSAAAAAAQLHAVAQTLFMNKAIPTGNKLLAKRERERQQKLHEARIKSMKPSVDNRPPPVYAHMVDKKKRDQLLEGADWLATYSCPPPLLIHMRQFSIEY